MNSSPHEIAKELYHSYGSRELNEADTRHQIINRIIHEVFSWPRNRVSCEEYIAPGYADYVLRKGSGGVSLLIEAKKEGIYFKLPATYNNQKTSRWIKISELLTDESISDAMHQVRNYCIAEGYEYAAITNGHEWIFFRPYVVGAKWDSMRAYVICSLQFFVEDFTSATNLLSYQAVTEKNSIRTHLAIQENENRPQFFPKEKITAYNQSVRTNRLAHILRPLANSYFGILSADDPDFMSTCYIRNGEFLNNTRSVQNLIRDTLSPYLAQHGVENAGDSSERGKVARSISQTIHNQSKGKVIVLFGGKGSGKSTFIRRLLELNPPEYIDNNTNIVIVDLLKVPPTREEIGKYVWASLVDGLDKDLILKSDRTELLKLFEDKYEIALKQELVGLDNSGERYNLMLNQKIAEWKQDDKYVANRLANYWGNRNKGIVVVIDNTDQYTAELQDYCFTQAQNISSVISSITVISMREERFRESKIHGLLDAFQNNGYHVQSPPPHTVFIKRLKYAKAKLMSGNIIDIENSVARDQVDTVSRFFDVLIREFMRSNSAIANFFNACAHGNIRLALDLFSGYLTSGYTNIEEMVAAGTFTINLHQVLKPVMIPERFFYEEEKSEFPNLFKVRSTTKGSHFTSQRILRWLDQGKGAGSSYIGINTIKDVFIDQYGMLEDLEKNLDLLLRYGLIEADNRLDYYSEEVDSLTITPYGIYALRELCGNFAYLDLVTLDCGVYDEALANELTQYGADDYRYFTNGRKYDRVKLRIDKVNSFLKYLSSEMQAELEKYGVDPRFGNVLEPVLAKYDADRERVLRSAKKNKSNSDEN